MFDVLRSPDHDGDASDTVTTFVYDAAGRLAEIVDALARSHTVGFDELGRVTSRTGPEVEAEAPVYGTSYGATGWVLSTTDPLGNVTNYLYENFGKKITVRQPHPTTGAENTGPQSSVEYDAVGNLVRSTDPLGRATSYGYDGLGRLVTVTLPDPDGPGGQSAPVWTYGYDKLGQRTSVTDPLGNVTSYAYNERGWLIQVAYADPDGEGGDPAPEEFYDYNAAGELIEFTDALGHVTSYAYDALGRLTLVTLPDPDGEGCQEPPETHYEYDAAGNLTAVVDALGNRTEYEYDAHDNLITVTQEDPDGEGPVGVPVWSFTYDDLGNLLTSSDPLGRVTTNAYDGLNRLVSVTLPDPDGVGALASPVWAYHYDLAGNLTSVVDPLTHTTSYAYDHLHRLKSVTEADPDGGGPLTAPVTQFGYDAASQLTSVTDPLGRVTSYAYSGLGLLTTVTQPDPDGGGVLASPVTTYAHDLVGNLTSATDPLGHVTAFVYDNLYRLKTITEPDPDGGGGLASPVTTFAYDALGQQTSRTDPLTHVTTFEYDGLGRLTKVTEPDPDGGGGGIAPYTTYVYDAVGNPTVVTDTFNHDYQYQYDNLYRQTRIIDPNGTSTWLGYDEVGNLVSLQDPEDNQTTWAYDDLDRVTSETTELGDARHFKYDAANNLIEKTDRNERVTQYVYDNLDRLKEEKWKDGASTIRTLTYTYDAASQLTFAGDPSAEYDLAYDGLGRPTSVVADLNGLTPDVTLTQAFDAASNRTSLKATIGATLDFQTTYAYDNLDRLTQVTQTSQGGGNAVAQKRVNFTYNAIGQFSTITRYANTAGSQLVATTTYGYDNTNRLTDLDHARSGTALAGYDLAWDAANRLTSLTDTQHSAESAAFTYDDFGQLTGADRASTPNDEAYAYDDNGNRETANGATYTIDTNNRITSDGTFTYDYDDEGNRILKTELSSGDYVEYEWDYRNRLTAVSFYDDSDVLQKRVEYDYDVFDRRVAKRVDSDGDTDFDSGQFFVYDGDHIALVFDSAGSLTNRYLHGPVIDQILADEQVHWTGSAYVTDHLYWPLTDHLGTVKDIAEFDPAANSGAGGTTVVNHLTFDAFGNIKDESGPTVDFLFSFTGRERDDDAGLIHIRLRPYDPLVARFISEDPSGFGGGDANLSRYVSNGATTLIDPFGLASIVPGQDKGQAGRPPHFYTRPESNGRPAVEFPVGERSGNDIRLRPDLGGGLIPLDELQRIAADEDPSPNGPYEADRDRLRRGIEAFKERKRQEELARSRAIEKELTRNPPDGDRIALRPGGSVDGFRVSRDGIVTDQLIESGRGGDGTGIIPETTHQPGRPGSGSDRLNPTEAEIREAIERAIEKVDGITPFSKALDGVQALLDLLGLIPGAGEVFDGLNALISAARGDAEGACLSGMAALPFFGWGATGTKWVRRAVKGLDKAIGAGGWLRRAAIAAARGFSSEIHHIASNKGEWGNRFKKLFEAAGVDIDSAINKMDLPFHHGRHTNKYHQWVMDQLEAAIAKKKGPAAQKALMEALERIRRALNANPRLPYLDGGL